MHEKVSVNALCFPGAGLPEMAEHWRALAPRRVGFMSSLLGDDLSLPLKILDAGGYQFESMTHLFFGGGHVESREEAWAGERAKLSRAIDAVAAFGGRSIYMMTGGHGDLTWEQAAECFSAALAPCVARADAAGVKLMVEAAPALYADIHLAHSLRDALTLAEIAGIGVCIDVYGCWAEAGLKQTIERAMPRCWLIQVADYVYGDRAVPSRAVPGDGNIPLRRILDWALSAGYAGGFDLELIGPRIDAEGPLEATRRAARQLGQLLESLGV
jgi:sugar phosphate isomerase/epimerase